MESAREILKEKNIKDLKSRNSILIDKSIDFELTSIENKSVIKPIKPLPQISPLVLDAIKGDKAFAIKRSHRRQDEFYQPYIKERDAMGKIIGSDQNNLQTLKPSPRQLLPSVFQFNK